jgi:hypothetical protein
MNQFFLKITADYWCAKNKLAEEAQQAAREFDRMLINESDIDIIINRLYVKIDFLNKKHSRCNPLKIEKASSYTHKGEEDAYIIPNVFHLTKYLVKETL